MAQILNVNGVEYIPAAAVGKQFGYTRDYILMLVRDGKIDGEKVGHKWYVDPSSAHRFFIEAKVVREARRVRVSAERKRELRAHTLKQRTTPRSTLLLAEGVAIILLALLIGTTGYLGMTVTTQEAQTVAADTSFFERFARALYAFIAPTEEVVTETSVPLAATSITATGDEATTTYTSLVVAPDTVLTTTTVDAIRDSFSDQVSVSMDPTNPDTGIIVPQFRDHDGEAYRFIMVPVNTPGQ